MAQDMQKSLVRLKDTDLTVPAEDDVRGVKVVDREGEQVGEVDALLVDEQDRRVRFLEVGSGGFLGIGEEKRLIPVDAVVRVDDDAVQVDLTRQAVAGSPVYDPDVVQDTPDYYEGLYGHYGYAPFWAPGYVYPGPFYR
jgi:sporulation protein YlmC with PRC-barrel domain